MPITFYAGNGDPYSFPTQITHTISYEEMHNGEGVPDGVSWFACQTVADEAAKAAWIRAMNKWLAASEEVRGMWGELKMSFEERDKNALLVDEALKEMQALEIH